MSVAQHTYLRDISLDSSMSFDPLLTLRVPSYNHASLTPDVDKSMEMRAPTQPWKGNEALSLHSCSYSIPIRDARRLVLLDYLGDVLQTSAKCIVIGGSVVIILPCSRTHAGTRTRNMGISPTCTFPRGPSRVHARPMQRFGENRIFQASGGKSRLPW